MQKDGRIQLGRTELERYGRGEIDREQDVPDLSPSGSSNRPDEHPIHVRADGKAPEEAREDRLQEEQQQVLVRDLPWYVSAPVESREGTHPPDGNPEDVLSASKHLS